MFVNITDFRGNQVALDPARVLRLRDSEIAGEPSGAVFIDYASGGVFARATLAEMVGLFGKYIRLAALHAPNNVPLYVNADGIASVEVDDQHAGNSVAVVTRDFVNDHVPSRNKIGLKETVLDATNIIAAAKRLG